MADAQKRITKAIGKINSALTYMERGRELNIKTDQAEQRLRNILALLGQVRRASSISLNIQGGDWEVPAFLWLRVCRFHMLQRLSRCPKRRSRDSWSGCTPNSSSTVRNWSRTKRILRRSSVARHVLIRRSNRSCSARTQQGKRNGCGVRRKTRRAKEATARRKAEDARLRAEAAAQKKAEQNARRQEQRNAMQSVRLMQRENTAAGTLYRSKRRAAINRIQYSHAPSLRNLPFASMLNAYMGYSFVRSELTKAIEYSNIMESAHSILKVADTDLKTFETRFDNMARHVRKIGIDTKYTAVEIAGAVKYLTMAGMNIDTIHKSIRPITNLALIGDNDVAYIADLATNIMAGYDINNDSMDSVADVIASTISRSNVNIVEVAESYKMAAGYLRMAGIDFTEASAAIGLLGNMGLKGTLAGTSLRAMATRFAKPTKRGAEGT